MPKKSERLVKLVFDEDPESNCKQDITHRDHRPRHRDYVRKNAERAHMDLEAEEEKREGQ